MGLKNIIHVVESNKLFEVSNYLVWKAKIRVVLLEKELWEYVHPVEETDNDSMVEELELTNIAETVETATKQE
jgi:hypothetical protein